VFGEAPFEGGEGFGGGRAWGPKCSKTAPIATHIATRGRLERR